MECRIGCGACCIAPSISSAIPGMPNGKLAGTRCIQLSAHNRCLIFDDPKRPLVCNQFLANTDECGDSSEEAIRLITQLEINTRIQMQS